MKIKSKPIILICCITALGVVALLLHYRWSERVGFQNIEACQKLKPGLSLDETEKILGKPLNSWINNRNEKWCAFETPSIYAGPISAEIEINTGRVLTLRCFEDGHPTWTLK